MEPQPSLAERSAGYLSWLEAWCAGLAPVSLAALIRQAGGPERVGVMVVDLLVGFCSEGPLASPRVGALAGPCAELVARAWDAGVRSIVLATDAHSPESREFAAFPPHCLAGTPEAEVIDELRRLPFYDQLARVRKDSINVGLEDALARWAADHEAVRTWIVVGDCTDLCVYQAAMHLRLEANARGLDREVWVPDRLVDTFDISLETAAALGAQPHPGDLHHSLFLHHMALNGIRIARDVEP